MTLINSYTKSGILRPSKVETDDFDLFRPLFGDVTGLDLRLPRHLRP